MQLRDIQTFGILGAGTLGQRIGLQAALSGFEVLTCDVQPAQIERAQRFHQDYAAKLVRRGKLSQEQAHSALSSLRYTGDAEAFAKTVDFVSESITEDLALKRRVWANLADLWPADCVLTTNTSYLLPSELAAASGHPERFCAFHFHDVFEARVVDVMPHPGTARPVIDFLLELGGRLEQIPVEVARETRGYLFNHMLMAYLSAAGDLLANDKASVADIDRSWMGNLGLRIGPFGMMDKIGLDTVDHVLSTLADRRSVAFRDVISPLVAAGHLGVKSGRGFYTYPDPAYGEPDFLLGGAGAAAKSVEA